MQKINKITFTVLILMIVLSFSNFFGVKIAGASVIIGVVFFFIQRANEK